MFYLKTKKILKSFTSFSTKTHQIHPLHTIYQQHPRAIPLQEQLINNSILPTNVGSLIYDNIYATPAIPYRQPQNEMFYSESINIGAPPLLNTNKSHLSDNKNTFTKIRSIIPEESDYIGSQANTVYEMNENTQSAKTKSVISIYCYCIGPCNNCKCVQADKKCTDKCHKGKHNDNCKNN